MGHLLGNVALALAALAFIVFVAMYHVTALWRETRMGRHMMAFNLVLAIILTYALIATVFGPLPAKEWVRLAIFSAIATVGWWRVTLLWIEQRDARNQPIIRGRHSLPDEYEEK